MARKASRRRFGTTKQLPSGRWRASYGDPNGAVTVTKSGKTALVQHAAPRPFLTREDAEAWLTDERRLISSGTWKPAAKRLAEKVALPIEFGEYAETWLETRKVKGKPLADRTRDGYRDVLDRFILPTFATIPLTSITPEMVDHWYEVTAVDTPTYRAHSYSLLRTILGTAVDRNIIKTANPAKVRGGGNTESAHEAEPATLEQLAIIIANMPERRRMMIQLDAWCSLRFGEITELRRKDIDMKAKVLYVRRGVVRTKEAAEDGTARTVRKVKAPKTKAGIRAVAIPPHLHADLAEHLLRHCAPGDNGLLFPGGSPTTHLASSTFYGRESTFFTDGARAGEIKRKGHGWYEARRIAGRPDLHFHDLRHTGLTNAAVAGATVAELMAIAGHSTPGAAMRYQHAAQNRLQTIAGKLSEMAGGD